MRSVRQARRPLVALVVLLAVLVIGYAVRAANSGDTAAPRASGTATASAPPTSVGSPTGTSSGPSTGSSTGGQVALSGLPPQAAATVRLIQRGGPFPYPRNDGVVFHNNEGRLPREPNGYYHEYTVATPGSATRGARRIITGRDGQYWYTGDHYETFVRVDVTR